jgi:hypothetical protein
MARLQIYRGRISQAQFDSGDVGAHVGAKRRPLGILQFPTIAEGRAMLVVIKAMWPPPLFGAIVDDGNTDDTAELLY